MPSSRRIAYGRRLRNAVRAGNRAGIRQALQQRAQDPSALVREHVAWALEGAQA